MRKDFRFGGSGGQGVISLAVLLANAYGVQNNYEVAQTQSYGPAARGGACKAELVVSDERIDYVKADKLDSFVAFNKPSFDKFKGDINPDLSRRRTFPARRPSRSSCSRPRSTLRKTSASCARTSS